MFIKTFQYRIYPSKTQEKTFRFILEATRNLYNMALEDRKLAWSFENRILKKTDGYQVAKNYKKTFLRDKNIHSHILQVVIEDLDRAFQAFFRRVKSGENPGYPQFKSNRQWNSFGLKQFNNGFSLDGRRLKIWGIGRIRVRWHRPYLGKIKTCRIIYKADNWYVNLVCELTDYSLLPKTGKSIGLDFGINNLITTSDNEKVENPRWYRASEEILKIKNKRYQRSIKGSNQRNKKLLDLQKQHLFIENKRKDFLNKWVYKFISQYDVIAIEDIKIDKLAMRNRLSKSIFDAGWGYFRKRLLDKAVESGREIILVDPAYTSKTCSQCNQLFENFSLNTRWVTCSCGLSLDRDHNAALNILKRAGHARES